MEWIHQKLWMTIRSGEQNSGLDVGECKIL